MKRKIITAALLTGLVCMTGCASKAEALHVPEPAEAEPIMYPESSTENAEAVPVSRMENQSEQVLTKDLLYYRCMNSLLYLDQLSGTITAKGSYRSPFVVSGNVSFDFLADSYNASIRSISAQDGETWCYTTETVKSGELLAEFTDFAEGYTDGAAYPEDCYRVAANYRAFSRAAFTNAETEWNGQALSVSEMTNADLYATAGQDPTGVHELGGCFIPQEMTSGYLEDFSAWEITGTDEMYGRECVRVEGTASDAYGAKMGVETFAVLVDVQTGIWLWYEGYDAQGTVQSYVYTEDMRFGAQADKAEPLTADLLEEKLAAGQYTMSGDSIMPAEIFARDVLG